MQTSILFINNCGVTTTTDNSRKTALMTNEIINAICSSPLPKNAAPIDWNDLFERIPDEPLLSQFAISYKDNTPALSERLKNAIVEKNLGQIESNAHAVKGSAANLGAIPLAKAAWQLENAARKNSKVDFDLLFEQLQTEYTRLIDLLAHPDWIDRLKKPQPA